MLKPTQQPIAKTQKQLLLLFYKFRFFTIRQLQKYLNHKDPHRIKERIRIGEPNRTITLNRPRP